MKTRSLTPILLATAVGGLLTASETWAGSLSGAFTQLSSSTVNLTAKGTIDWVHWGFNEKLTSVNRKSNVTPQISGYTAFGNGFDLNAFGNTFNGYSWSDGSPTATTANASFGIFHAGQGAGFELTVPASTTARTLKLYVGTYNAQMHFEASLSDNSAPMYVNDTFGNVGDGANREVTLNFAADSPGQTLKVRFSVLEPLGDGDYLNVTLQAAALTESAPLIEVTTPQSGTIFHPAANELQFTASNESPLNIPVNSVKLLLNGQDVSSGLTITGNANSRSATYSGLLPNKFYNAECIAADNTGRATTNLVTFDTFTFADTNAVIIEAEDYNYGDGATNGLFIDVTDVGQYATFSGAQEVDFLIANPSAGGYRPDGVRMQGTIVVDQPHGGGPDYFIEATSPNDWLNYTRTFPSGRYNVYVRYASQVTPSKLQLGRVTSNRAEKNQTVEPIATLNVPDNNDDNLFRYITLTDGAGQLLSVSLSGVETLRWTRSDAEATAKLRLNYFVLVRASGAPQAQELSIRASGNDVVLSFATETGVTYTLEHKNSLAEAGWQTNSPAITGDGNVKTVTQPRSESARFYRLSAQ